MSELERLKRRAVVVRVKMAAMLLTRARKLLDEAARHAVDVGDDDQAEKLRESWSQIGKAKVRAGRAISPRPQLIESVPDHVPDEW